MEKIPQIKVNRLYFKDNRIYIDTDTETLSQSLYHYPILLNATDEQRKNYTLSPFGIHWEEIDEDVSFESFYYEEEEPNEDNEVARIFKSCPELNVSEVARTIGINKSLLSKYIYGTKKPSDKRLQEIKTALQKIGKRILEVA